jgi:uncharacterized protein YjbI with pentapeptide repeats
MLPPPLFLFDKVLLRNLIRQYLKASLLTDANLEGADLRGAIFDIEQIKKAKNWDKAIYDPEVRKKLGLP